MATDAEEPGNDLIATYEPEDALYSPTWRILRNGQAYLAERKLL